MTMNNVTLSEALAERVKVVIRKETRPVSLPPWSRREEARNLSPPIRRGPASR
jgi:hypothetical protein